MEEHAAANDESGLTQAQRWTEMARKIIEHEGRDAFALRFVVGFVLLLGFHQRFDQLVADLTGHQLEELEGLNALRVLGEAHAEAELGVVLEEGV